MSRLVYGLNPVRELLRAEPATVEELVLTQGRVSDRLARILALAKAAGIKTRRRPRSELTRLAGTEDHQGVVLKVGDFSYTDLEEMLDRAGSKPGPRLLIILDGIMDPHNLGAIARTGLAAGAAGMIIKKDRAAGVTPAAMKASAGGLSRLPVARATNLNRTAELLQERGWWLLGTDVRGPVSLYELEDLPENLALVVGSEDRGLGRALKEKCDFLVRLPLPGPMESLNASAAAAVVLFELVRRGLTKD